VSKIASLYCRGRRPDQGAVLMANKSNIVIKVELFLPSMRRIQP
jgi:hypothetical protein